MLWPGLIALTLRFQVFLNTKERVKNKYRPSPSAIWQDFGKENNQEIESNLPVAKIKHNDYDHLNMIFASEQIAL